MRVYSDEGAFKFRSGELASQRYLKEPVLILQTQAEKDRRADVGLMHLQRGSTRYRDLVVQRMLYRGM
jgi:hypothetical protein